MNFTTFLKEYFETVGLALSLTWWWAGPIVLFWLFKILWRKYSLTAYLMSLDNIILEIKPPRNVERSPRTMEQIFAALHGVWATPNLIDKIVKGKWVQPLLSFEIHGVNGEMHFYVRCERRFRDFIESLFYSQYPEVEINEVEDYINSVPKNAPNAEWDLWGVDFRLAKDDAYPIRTYKYFKEEVTKGMIDPLAEIADVIAALPPDQHVWIQIIVTPAPDKDWTDTVQKLVLKLARREQPVKAPFPLNVLKEIFEILKLSFQYIFHPVELPEEKKVEEKPIRFHLTPGEEEAMKAVESSLTKKGYLTKLRFIYVGRREGFDRGFLAGINGAIQQFNDMTLNSFIHDNETKTFANYIFVAPRLYWAQRKIFTRYLDRDIDGPKFVLNSEELATVYHMPDISVMSPSVARIEAKKSGAPLNLPVE